MRNLALSTLALAAAAALAAAPAPVPATAFERPAAHAASGSAAHPVQVHAGWWPLLRDPALSALIEQGLEANLDMAQAHARVRRSKALLAGAQAAFGPTGGAGLQGRAVQASETEAPSAAAGDRRRSDSVGAALEFSWELDLFGRLDHQAGAAAQRMQASEARLQGTRLAVSTEIAHAYFALVGAREQLDLARTVAANRQQTLRLVSARADGGLAAPMDDVRARADVEEALADIPAHEAAIRLATHRLAVLTGRAPAEFALATGAAVEPGSVAIPVAGATDWLAQRPDVLEHEAMLRARALDVKAVRAEFYPRLSFTGLLGFVAGSVAGLGAAGSVSWLSAPSLMVPLLDRTRIAARLAAAEADQREALAAYRQRILLAIEEVENALARYSAGQQQFEALQRRAQLSLQAERLARVRYDAGAADLLELLDAQRSARQAQSTLAAALMQQRQHLVAVFKGMGASA